VIHGVGFASYGRFKSTIVKIKNGPCSKFQKNDLIAHNINTRNIAKNVGPNENYIFSYSLLASFEM
jgi:hypothetical protein